MKANLTTLALAALVLAASSGCVHRTVTTHTSDTIRTDNGPEVVAPQPVIEDSTTVIKRSHTTTEGGQ